MGVRAVRVALGFLIALPVAMGSTKAMMRAISLQMSPPAPRVIRTPVERIKPLPQDMEALYRLSRELSPKQIATMKERVERDPGDSRTRALLLEASWYDRGDKNLKAIHNEQVAWFVANMPNATILSKGTINVDNVTNIRTYELVNELYDEALPKYAKDPNVMANYAAFLLIGEKDRAIELLTRATELDPKNPERYHALAFAHYLASRGLFDKRDKTEASLAVDNYLKEWKLQGNSNPSELIEAAFDAERLDVVDREANAVLVAHNSADALHAAHTVLGRVALKKGDLEAAKSHLLDSAKVTGSPVLGSFGPNMELARELLAKGERKTVLAYLKATGEFWKDPRQAEWTKTVADGGTPDWN